MTTDPDFTIASLFDTTPKRWRAAGDFAAGLLASLVTIAAIWLLA